MQRDIDQQHEQHHQHRQAHDQQTEVACAQLKRSGRRLAGDAVGNGADGRLCPRFDQPYRGAPADDRGAHKYRIARVGQFCGRRWWQLSVLFNRVGFAGQQGLLHEKVAGLDHPGICGNQIAGAKFHDIPRYNLGYGDLLCRAITAHTGTYRDGMAQFLGGGIGAVLLDKVQRHAKHDDATDDDEIHHLAAEGRDGAGGQQNDH